MTSEITRRVRSGSGERCTSYTHEGLRRGMGFRTCVFMNARTDRYRWVGPRFSGWASGGRWRGWLPWVKKSGGGIRETRVYTRGRQEVVFKWITVPADDSAGKKRACDNLTDGVGDYPAMRNIRAKKTAAAGKVKKRPRACINVINNNSRRRWRREKPAPDHPSPPTPSSHNI
ncbi:hypothetical protein QTP88_008491 [Uroleucon formosanum]